MYGYIYDEFLAEPKYRNELADVESRLTDLGLSGKVVRLALFRDPGEMIRDEVRRGLTTVVAVGNDATAKKVLDAVADTGVVFGMIPMGEPQGLARILGIPTGIAACDTLSSRIVETIDSGLVNGRRFIAGVTVPRFKAELICDGYKLSPTGAGSLEIRNLAAVEHPTEGEVGNPRDGLLEVVIRTTESGGWFKKRKMGKSIIPLQTLEIRSQETMTVLADGEEMHGNRFDITVEPMTFKVITGKTRMF